MFTRTTVPAMSLLVAALLILNTGNVVSAGDSGKRGGKAPPKRLPFFEQVPSGETVEILSFGPFTVTAGCNDYNEATLFTTVTAKDEDEWVFGYPDFERRGDGDDDAMCIGLHPAGTSANCEMWASGAGTWNPAAYQSLSGYYVGVVGHTIGFDFVYMSDSSSSGPQVYHWYREDDLAAFPSDKYKCMVAGVLEYFN